jgi:hypothetical protein
MAGAHRPRILVVAVIAIAIAVALSAVVGTRGTRPTTNSKLTVALLASLSTMSTAPPRDNISPNGAGWALTTRGLEITSNGGASFEVVNTPVPVASVGDVSFNGTAIVIAGWKNFKPWVQYSTNMGASWTVAQLPQGSGNAGGVQLVTDNNVVVGMMITDVTSSNFSAGEWYPTPNGGLTWSHYAAPSGGPVTASHGVLWIVGGPVGNRLYKSTDSGSSWSNVLLPTAVVAKGAALSLPGAFRNGVLALVAQTPTSNSGSTYGLAVYLSSDRGAAWSLGGNMSLPGSIGYGVGATTAISSNVLWIGSSSGVPRIVRFVEGGGFSVTTSVGPYRQGFVSALSGQNATSLWATVQDGVCPSGKASCMQVGSLSATNDSGQNWSLVNLTPMSLSPS